MPGWRCLALLVGITVPVAKPVRGRRAVSDHERGAVMSSSHFLRGGRGRPRRTQIPVGSLHGPPVVPGTPRLPAVSLAFGGTPPRAEGSSGNSSHRLPPTQLSYRRLLHPLAQQQRLSKRASLARSVRHWLGQRRRDYPREIVRKRGQELGNSSRRISQSQLCVRRRLHPYRQVLE